MFNNRKPCPYEAIGSMFHHSQAGACKKLVCTNDLCQFEHPKEMIEEEEAANEIEEISDDDMSDMSEADSISNQEVPFATKIPKDVISKIMKIKAEKPSDSGGAKFKGGAHYSCNNEDKWSD